MQCRWLRGLTFSLMILAGCGGRHSEPRIESRLVEGSFSSPQAKIVGAARNLLGAPYLFGGTTPEGFDCSGYVAYVYSQSVGKKLPRRAAEQIKFGKAISPAKRGPGDLLYFWIEEQQIFHVGIYLGEDQFIHAPSRQGAVNIQRLHDPYWNRRYRGARRII